MRKGIFLSVILIIGLLFSFHCEDSPTGDDTGNKITGTAKDPGGSPVQGATVKLLEKGASGTTDASGAFTINTSAVVRDCGDSRGSMGVIDTLLVSHDGHLYKKKFVYSYSDAINAIVWDKKYRLTNEISGWADQSGDFYTFDTLQLYDIIDGGAEIYNEEGMIDGINQVLLKGADTTCDVFIHNFSNAKNAQAMFTRQTENISDARKVLIDGFDESVVVGNKNPLGSSSMIYAHFGQFELELLFRGHSTIESMKADAALFLQHYKTIIGSIGR